jgi:hypothetical protein
LPLSKNLLAVLGFLVDCGFSPASVSEALEYRAQLVALCEAAEPRLVLAECLAAADAESAGNLAHGEAYRELVGDLIAAAADDLARFPALDAEHYLLYQLHCLSGEDVRQLARVLAKRHGMIAD